MAGVKGKRAKKAKPAAYTQRQARAVPGKRVGTKRSDMRWMDPDGGVWASRFEYEVYLGFKLRGANVRRASSEDSMAYTVSVRNANCTECNATKVVQRHSYCPDLFVDQAKGRDSDERGYFAECKGYLRGNRRALLRGFRATGPRVDLRIVLQRDYKVGQGTVYSWCVKYMKCPVFIWQGPDSIPASWL